MMFSRAVPGYVLVLVFALIAISSPDTACP